MSTAPASGAKVAQLSTFEGPKNIARRSWSVNQEVEEDDGEPASEGAVEIGLDPARLDAPHAAPALDGRVGQQVDRAVHDVLVDGAVDVGEEAGGGAGEVHEPVDEVAVEPGHEASPGERGLDDDPVVQLVDVVLVVDDGPRREEALLDARRDRAPPVLVERPGEDEAHRPRRAPAPLETTHHPLLIFPE